MTEEMITPGVLYAGMALLGLASILGTVSMAMRIWDMMKPQSPCIWGSQKAAELERRMNSMEDSHDKHRQDIDARLQRGTRAMKHIEGKIEESVQRMEEKQEKGLMRMEKRSEENDQRITDRLDQLVTVIHEMKGSVDAIREDRRKGNA